MPLFHPDNRYRSARHARVFARFELVRTVVDFMAAMCFVVGSVFYFFPETTVYGTWLFLIGSILFGVKPTIKLSRELTLLRMAPSNGEGGAAPRLSRS